MKCRHEWIELFSGFVKFGHAAERAVVHWQVIERQCPIFSRLRVESKIVNLVMKTGLSARQKELGNFRMTTSCSGIFTEDACSTGASHSPVSTTSKVGHLKKAYFEHHSTEWTAIAVGRPVKEKAPRTKLLYNERTKRIN